MYGSQDSSHTWQLDCVNQICGELGGFRRGKHSAALFHNPNQDVRMSVHGDDFVCLSDDVGTKEMGLIESESEDAEKSWLCMVADSVAINQFSMDGSHSLVVGSVASVHVCPKTHATHATLSALPECWRGLDLRSASGKMLKVWCMREVVYNAMDLHGEVFVCEVRRPMLSMAMLEDKGLHLTVGDGCRKLGGHGREMNGLLGCEESMLRGPPGFVAHENSGVAGLSAPAGVWKRE